MVAPVWIANWNPTLYLNLNAKEVWSVNQSSGWQPLFNNLWGKMDNWLSRAGSGLSSDSLTLAYANAIMINSGYPIVFDPVNTSPSNLITMNGIITLMLSTDEKYFDDLTPQLDSMKMDDVLDDLDKDTIGLEDFENVGKIIGANGQKIARATMFQEVNWVLSLPSKEQAGWIVLENEGWKRTWVYIIGEPLPPYLPPII